MIKTGNSAVSNTFTSVAQYSQLSQWWIQGEAQGAHPPPPPPYFQTKLRPEGLEKKFWRPPSIPPYLKVWIRHSL